MSTTTGASARPAATLSAVERRAYIRERYRQDGEAAVAEALGLTRRAVKNVAHRLGILPPRQTWTDEQDAVIREAYAEGIIPPGILDRLAARLGRSRMAVALRVSRLGLGDYTARHMPEADLKKPKAKYTPEERSRVNSERFKQHWAENEHPRGFLGRSHSPETRARVSEASRKAWADPTSGLNSEEQSQRRSDSALARVLAGDFLSGEASYTRAAGGRRADLDNRYFRSAWEANYARFLNFMMARGEIISWDYEIQTFTFDAIKRGARAYTPDFRVLFPDGHHEWHEVKGWMDPKSATKLKRMTRYYPSEIVKVIDEAWFREMTAGLSGAIPGWERRK